MTEAVNKDMPIGDVVEKYPQVVPVILSYGLHCVGCHVSPYETIEQGAMGHGMSVEDVASMVKDINEAITESKSESPVSLTVLAAAKLKEFIAQEQKQDSGLRVMATPAGCSGYTYDMQFEDKPHTNDVSFENKGIKIFVDPTSLELIRGSTIDFLEDIEGGGFKVNNPNVGKSGGCGSGSCGCGTGKGSGSCGCGTHEH